MNNWPLRESPVSLRPREKAVSLGISALSGEELLAVILGSGRVGENVVFLARRLLKESGGLRELKNWTVPQLTEVDGIGPAKAVAVQAALALGVQVAREAYFDRPEIRRGRDLLPYIEEHLRDRPREVFWGAFLDGAHRLITLEELFAGGLDYAAVSSRIVVEKALAHRAAAVVVAHNHPSGVAEASREDEDLTNRLRQALDLVEIRLLDHLLVAGSRVVSVRGC